MDNLTTHKMAADRAAIVAVGATVIFLPPYSLELNPIERLWADTKGAYVQGVVLIVTLADACDVARVAA